MSAPSRRLIILRHGRTGHNLRGIWQGHLDTDLDEVGRAQAAAAGLALRAYQPSFIISSDLARAHQSAVEVGRACGVPVETDTGLREIHVGQWQGQSTATIAQEYAEVLAAIDAGEDPRRGVTGETFAKVTERVRLVLHAAVERLEPGHTAILVTHGVTARAAAADLAGIDRHSAWTGLATLDNCHWAVVDEFPGRARDGESAQAPPTWRVAGWNLAAPDLGMPRPSG